MPSQKVQEDILTIAVEEQRKVYDWIADGTTQVRIKILALLGGGLTALAFLYSAGSLFIPPQTYGKIFYFSAIGMLVVAFTALIHSLKPLHWEFPIEDKDLLKISKVQTKLEYLEYVKEKYMECYTINISAYNYKQKLFNVSLYPLIFGIIILVVIKLFK